jgi:hypothetical protein
MKRFLALLLLLCSCATLAAPVNDASGTAGADCSGDSTPSVAVTVSSGSDRYGIGWVYWEGAVTISSPTFAAQTPTLHHTHASTQFVMYRLAAPSTGAQTFGVTLSGAPSRCYIGWLTYSGVASVGTAVADIVESGTTVDVDVTSASGDMAVDAAVFAEATIVVGAGQTARIDADNFGSTFRSFGASEEAGAATVTMSWTTGGATDGFIIAANLVAAGGGGSTMLLRRRRG